MSREFDTHIETDGVSFDARDADLLRAIDDHGSIHAATNALERSYAHAQRRVVELEEAVGPLVERKRGGSGGGGSTLTDDAADLLARFERLETAADGLTAVEETVLPGRVIDRDGELGTVETAVGTVRALVPAAEAVEVTLRSDAITLTAPEDTPAPEDTSARNRFSGRVIAADAGETVVRVGIDIGGETPLLALVTRASVDRLGLEPGREVVTSFKATATRATPARDLDTD